MTTTLETNVQRAVTPVSASEAAKTSSANARINIPLNLENWAHLPEEIQKDLLWFHQHALDSGLTYKDCSEALDYDESTVFRVLKGTYEGSWKNIADSIRSFRRLEESRASIQQNEFSETPWTQTIFSALDYAMANNSIAIVIGESRQGKSCSVVEWKRRNNHGRSVYVIAPAYGGAKALLTAIAEAVGVNKNLNAVQTHGAVLKAFNRHRILIIDEAHRLLPGDRRTNPVLLEIIRDLHDRTGCAVALIATARFSTELTKSDYMFEQLIGRSMVTRLEPVATEAEVEPIVRQYVTRPGRALLEACVGIANKPGHLGILVETLKVASRIAKKAGEKMNEDHFFKSVKIREKLQGKLLISK